MFFYRNGIYFIADKVCQQPVNVESYSAVQWMLDRSGKPGTKRSATQRSEDLQRIAGTTVDGCIIADSPELYNGKQSIAILKPMHAKHYLRVSTVV